MNPGARLLQHVAEHLPSVMLGATVLLALGALACPRRDAALRQRIAEVAVAAALAWTLLVLVPLPRITFPWPAALVPAPAASTPRTLTPTHFALAPEPRLRDPAAAAHQDIASIPATIPASVRRWNVRRTLTAGWMIGAALIACWLGCGMARVRRIVRHARPIDAGPFAAAARAARATVMISDAATGPFCCGIRRLIVVIPRTLWERGNAPLLDAVLRHELVHARRRDGAGQLVFALAWPLFYCHPLWWLLRRRARLAAELIADDHAARSDGRRAFARRLIALAELDLPAAPPPFTAAASANRSDFTRRIEMLLGQTPPLADRCSRRSRWLLSATALLVLVPPALYVGSRTAAAQDQQVEAMRQERDALRERVRSLEETVRALEAPRTTIEVEVQLGDTVASLFRTHTGQKPDLVEFQRLNPDVDPNRLHVGQRLLLPATPRIATAPAAARETELTDLAVLDLLTRRIDLDVDVRLLEQDLAHSSPLLERGAVTQAETARIAARLEAAQRKQQLVEALIASEVETMLERIAALEQTLRQNRVLAEKGFVTAASVRADEARLAQLQRRVELLTQRR